MSNFVFLIDSNKTPMNPIHPAHAAELMKKGKAAVFRMYPFTLIMTRVVDNIVTYPLSLRIDPGSKFTGISLVNNRDEAVWGMELQHRGLAIGTSDIKDFLVKKPELLKKVQLQAKRPLKDAAAVNSTRWKLFEVLKQTNIPVLTGSGGLTKFNRTRLELPKTHWLDAACVGVVDTLKVLTNKILSVKATGHGCRRMTRIDKYGFPCTAAKQTFNQISTGDFVKATIQKDRKNVMAGTYAGRVKTPTPKGCEVVINGFRVGFSSMQDLKIIHHSDGFSYA